MTLIFNRSYLSAKLLVASVTLGLTLQLEAQLLVRYELPQITGDLAVVRISLQNKSKEDVEAARAVAFLINSEGKIIGQSTRWVIGGDVTTILHADTTNFFSFVIPVEEKAGTNFSTRITFTRLVFAGGRVANPGKETIVFRAQDR